MMAKNKDKTTKKALRIISDNPKITAREFAKKMYPKSKGWERRIGRNSIRGMGMWLWAGGYLRKLEKKGFVRQELSTVQQSLWSITFNGTEQLLGENGEKWKIKE